MALSGFVMHTTGALFCKCRKNNWNYQRGTNKHIYIKPSDLYYFISRWNLIWCKKTSKHYLQILRDWLITRVKEKSVVLPLLLFGYQRSLSLLFLHKIFHKHGIFTTLQTVNYMWKFLFIHLTVLLKFLFRIKLFHARSSKARLFNANYIQHFSVLKKPNNMGEIYMANY